MRVLFLFLLSVLNIQVEAAPPAPKNEEIFIARITGNFSDKTYDIFLELNPRKLISAMKTRNNKKKKTKRYGLDILSKPIPLAKAAGVVLVSLKCLRFNTAKGCDIEIEYPSNIALGRFKTFKTKLKRKEGKWGFYDEKGNAFTRMHLVSKKVLGILVGIKRIEIRSL